MSADYLSHVARPLGQVTNNEPLPVLRQRLGGQLDGHRYVRAVRPTVPHAVGLEQVLGDQEPDLR